MGTVCKINLFTNMAAIVNAIVSNAYDGMPRGQVHINLSPKHPIMSLKKKIEMAAKAVKRSIDGIRQIS